MIIPPEVTIYLPYLIAGLAAMALGIGLARMAGSGKTAALGERIKAEERRATELEARLAAASANAERHETEAQTFRNQVTELRSRLEAEIKAAREKQELLERSEQKLTHTFKALSADALRSSSEQFLQLAKASLATQSEEARNDIEKRKLAIAAMVQPVAESLGKFEFRVGEIEKAREGAYAELKEQVRALGEGQLGLQRETASLVRALRQPTGRGQWGEMQLRRVVELAGMQEHCDFETQHSTTSDEGRSLRPDLVVRLPGGKCIVVDSKTPMDAYLDALEATEDPIRDLALQRHAQQVRNHIQQLSSKNYSAQFAHDPEFTVLFLPSESFFSAALQSDPGLIERGVKLGIILATPTTLIALLRAVAYGWRQEAMAENAREISALGRMLHERIGKLTDHFAKLGRSLGSAVDNYNNAVGSLETRVLASARKFEDLKAAPASTSIPQLQPIDHSPRRLQSTIVEAPPSDPDLITEPADDDENEGFMVVPKSAASSPTDGMEDDDFTFVPDPAPNPENAAAALRNALG